MNEYEIFIIPAPINSDFQEKCHAIIKELQKDTVIYGVGIGETTTEELKLFLEDIINTAAEKRKWKNTTI